jgi:glycerophosphoryl diester phosphodiesterase
MFFRLLFIATFLSSCTKSKDYSAVKVIGHGATGLKNISSVYHDNSKEAAELALTFPGCDGVELDVQLSKDKHLWFCHDLNLKEEIGISDCIPNLDSESLFLLHYRTLKKEKLFPLEQLPLKEFQGKTLILDLKHYNACSEAILSSTDFIEELKEVELNGIDFYINLNYSSWVNDFYNADLDRLLITIHSYSDYLKLSSKQNMFVGIMVRNSEISATEVLHIQNDGKLVFLYEVRAPKESRQALSKLPNYILSDDLRTTIIEK